MTLKQTVRKAAKQGNLVPAIVRAIYHGKVTVQLSGNGAIMRMLTLTGGPVEIGQWIHVDFTTNPPLAVAPSPLAVPILDGGRKAAVAKRTPLASPPPRPPAIEVFPGPPPTTGKPDSYPKASYPVTAAGLEAATQIVATGDVIYIPACDLDISSYNLGFPGNAGMDNSIKAANISVIGESQQSTILRGAEITAYNNVTVRDISFIFEATSASVQALNIYACGDATFYNCYFRAWNTDAADDKAANVLSDFSIKLRFFNCTFESSYYGVRLNNEPYDALNYNVAEFYVQAQANVGAGDFTPELCEASGGKTTKVTCTWPQRTYSNPSSWTKDSIVWLAGAPPGKVRKPGWHTVVKLLYTGDTTSGSPKFTLGHQSEVGANFSFSPPYPGPTWLNMSEIGPIEYINGVADADGVPYSSGDIVEWRIAGDTYYEDGIHLAFDIFRHDSYQYQASGPQSLRFEEIYIVNADGTKEYLYPSKPYAYLEECTLVTSSGSPGSEGYDLAAHTGSWIETNNTYYDKEKTIGTVLSWGNGHPPVYTSGSAGEEPEYTWPGQTWIQPSSGSGAPDAIYLRNEDDTDWYEFLLAGSMYLNDLADVTSGSASDTEALCYSQALGQWVPTPQLQFSGLAKITVSSGSPANPSVGDIWINTT